MSPNWLNVAGCDVLSTEGAKVAINAILSSLRVQLLVAEEQLRSELGPICRNFRQHREWGSSGTREKAEGFVDLEQQREGRGFWYWLAFLQSPIWLLVSVSSGCIRLLQLCTDRFPHSMDQHPIDIVTVNERNSAEIEEPPRTEVGEELKAYEASTEVDDTSDVVFSRTNIERRIRTLAEVKGLEPTKGILWNLAYEHYSENLTKLENLIVGKKEEMRSIKNEIYQVIGFFSAFQGLLITAAAQSNLLRCNNVGFILALSAFAMAVAVFGIWQKITAIEELRFGNISIDNDMQELNLWLSHLRHMGINFDFDFLTDSTQHEERRSRTPWKEILVSYGAGFVISVIAFGGLCMVAMRQIVCNPGHSLPSN